MEREARARGAFAVEGKEQDERCARVGCVRLDRNEIRTGASGTEGGGGRGSVENVGVLTYDKTGRVDTSQSNARRAARGRLVGNGRRVGP